MEEQEHCFHVSQDGRFVAGSPRKICPVPCLSSALSSAPAKPLCQGTAVTKTAVCGVKPKPSNEGTPDGRKIAGMTQGRSLG